MKPLLHPRTETDLRTYLAQPTHGLLLTGRSGVGKLTVAQWLAEQQQATMHIVRSAKDKSTITIDQVRDLYNLTRTGRDLVVIIENAHQMNTEAQNAFLKLLEEPPKNTRFILTTADSNQLLSTVRSRSQSITVTKPKLTDLMKLASTQTELSAENLKSLAYTSEGLPGSFLTLIYDSEQYQFHTASIAEAKEFYGTSIYRRHLICIEHTYQKEWSEQLLNILALIITSLLKQPSLVDERVKKLTAQAALIEITAQNLLSINGNPKIHLARLCELL